jgi:FYVE zinc finger
VLMSTSIRDSRRDARIIALDMGDSDSGSSYAGSDGSLENEHFLEEALHTPRERTLSAEDPQAEVSGFEGRPVQDRTRIAAQGLAQASGSQGNLPQRSDILPTLGFSSSLGVSVDQLDGPERTDEQPGYRGRPLRTEWIEQGHVLSRARGELLDSALAPSLSQEQSNQILGVGDSVPPPRMTGETCEVTPLYARRPTTTSNRTNDAHLQSTSILRLAKITVSADSGSTPRDGRDVGDIMLPRWQPDAEVTYCPICHTQFSFFVRKHHCR